MQAPLHTVIRVIDTETTDMTDEAEICEIGWTDLVMSYDGWVIADGPHARLCSVMRLIEPEARAAHHITDEELEDQPAFDTLLPGLLDKVDYFAAHNADFDRRFIATDKPWLCTMKLACALWPAFPSYSNQALRYRRGLKFDRPALTLPAHRAGPDTYVTATLLMDLLKEVSPVTKEPWPLADHVKVSALPKRIHVLNFGKHKGTALVDVPSDYLDWIVNTSDMDEAVKWNARRELKRR